MTAAPLLLVEDLAAGYGGEPVLEGVSLRVEPGEIVVVLGASGCGKSTLLRCIVGLLEPARGRVLVEGRDVARAEGAEREAILRRIGMAFQSAALLNSLTVAENVALPIREHLRLDARTARMLACLHLSRVGLAEAADLLPSELSGGMRKRAGLARALALDPALLLFDEPSAGLDPMAARGLDDLILRLRDRGGLGVVVVTHELGSIEAIADRALMLSGGRVLAAGTLDEVRAHPDPEVQAFFARTALPRTRGAGVLDDPEGDA
jgi:phospholipid/cholesterol/gamma-HCH transport system ATP-binding protein